MSGPVHGDEERAGLRGGGDHGVGPGGVAAAAELDGVTGGDAVCGGVSGVDFHDVGAGGGGEFTEDIGFVGARTGVPLGAGAAEPEGA